MSNWRVGEKFDDRLNGYPIICDGKLVAIAVYSGGTEPARKNAELIVTAMNKKPHRRSYTTMLSDDDYCGQCGGPCLRRPRHGEAWG